MISSEAVATLHDSFRTDVASAVSRKHPLHHNRWLVLSSEISLVDSVKHSRCLMRTWVKVDTAVPRTTCSPAPSASCGLFELGAWARLWKRETAEVLSYQMIQPVHLSRGALSIERSERGTTEWS